MNDVDKIPPERTRIFKILTTQVRSHAATEMLDAYAHALAEQIRAKARMLGVFRSEDMQLRSEAMRRAADLIDPKGGEVMSEEFPTNIVAASATGPDGKPREYAVIVCNLFPDRRDWEQWVKGKLLEAFPGEIDPDTVEIHWESK